MQIQIVVLSRTENASRSESHVVKGVALQCDESVSPASRIFRNRTKRIVTFISRRSSPCINPVAVDSSWARFEDQRRRIAGSICDRMQVTSDIVGAHGRFLLPSRLPSGRRLPISPHARSDCPTASSIWFLNRYRLADSTTSKPAPRALPPSTATVRSNSLPYACPCSIHTAGVPT